VDIGPRSYRDPANLESAADFLSNRLAALGYHVTEQSYQAEGLPVRNITQNGESQKTLIA